MKREEELQLEYEDILFKIMMDRVAQAEGAQMLEENQHLLEIPDAAARLQNHSNCLYQKETATPAHGHPAQGAPGGGCCRYLACPFDGCYLCGVP